MIIGDIAKKERIKENDANVTVLKSKRIVGRTIVFAIIIVLLSDIYLVLELSRYQYEASFDAISLAQSLKALIPEEYIAELSGSAEDLNKFEYNSIKNHLKSLVETTSHIRFAYLLTEQNGNISILLDSESPDSPDYSPPGKIYEEANEIFHEPFKTGNTIITRKVTDRWGAWISVLVPIKDTTNGKIQAVFCIDYSASEWYAHLWKHMIPNIIIIICILIFSFAMLYGRIQHTMNQSLSQKLSYSEVLYRSIFEQAPVGIAIVNGKNFTYQSDYGHNNINPMFQKILGRTNHELANLKWTDITHPEDLEVNLQKYEEFKNGKNSGYTLEKRYIKPDGSAVWTNIKISPLLGLKNNNSLHLTLVEDISERKQIELALIESERKMAVLLSHLPGMAYRCYFDSNRTMQFVSEGSWDLTGYVPESLLNNRVLSYNDIISPEYRECLRKEWESVLAKRLPFKYEYEITTASGDRKWVLEMGKGIYNSEGELEALEGIVLDITDRKGFENNLKYINEHDRWTGLYNRDYLETLLIDNIQNTQKQALISINLSTVQLLTANYGFHYTQNLIKSASEALSHHCSDKCMLFKTYENRFVFYLKDYKEKSELIEFSKGIAQSLENLFVTDRIGGGIGILEINEDNEMDVDMLLKRLLIASERATNNFNKDFSYCFYNKELEELVNREGDIRQELSRIASGDDCGELFLQYQPILNLKTNSVGCFEALARLRTEKLGFVSPMEFIPIAEKTKLIIPIGEKVIIKALRFLIILKEHGYDSINISINISAIQLLRPGFAERLFSIINEMQVNPNNIGIEITESIFSLDFDEINKIISRLRDAGIHIAIDDFGTGYSSLAREKELSVNCLKIDKYFVDKLLDTNHNELITGDIIAMAHRLGHYAIAEGVEYEEQKQYLIDHGCDMIQGYLIGKPLDEEAVIKLLKNQQNENS